MTRDEAVARIQRGLGFRDDLTDEIIASLKEARRLLETGRSLPDFLLQEEQTLNVPAGSANVALPDGFIREWQEQPLRFTSPDNDALIVVLEKLDYIIGEQRFPPDNTDAGRPIAYTLLGSSIKFWPAERDTSYALRWAYYKHSVDLSTNVADNEWLQDDDGGIEALIGRAGQIIAGDLADTVSLQKFSAMHAVGWNAITSESDLQDQENRPLAMGSRL